MRILIISRGYPSVRDPQFGSFERDHAEALTAIGHQVAVISVDRRFRLYWRRLGVSRKKSAGISVYSSFLLPNVFFYIWGEKLYFHIAMLQLKRLYRLIEKECMSPDVICSHYLYNTAMAVNLKRYFHVPVVAIEHWSKLSSEKISPFVRWLGQKAYPQVDSLLAVSTSLANRICQHFGIQAKVIHNMVNGDFFKNRMSSDVVKCNECFTFVNVGSLFPIKGQDVLIKAFAKANFDNNVKLLIVGEGRRRMHLQNLVETLNMQEKVTLLGRKNKDDIIRILSSSDVFVLSSLSENFSVAVIEGLAMGLPVVATLCGGTDECISDFNGLLVPVGDIEGLAVALKQIYVNYDKYDKVAIAEDCKREYSPDVIVKKLEQVFIEVVNKK